MFLLVASSVKLATIFSFDALKHSQFSVRLGWLEGILISPHMHQVHHSSLERHWDKNYGTNLSIYDWLFRTAYKPRQNEEIVYGIYGLDAAGLARFSTFRGALASPVASMVKLLMPRRKLVADVEIAVSGPATPD